MDLKNKKLELLVKPDLETELENFEVSISVYDSDSLGTGDDNKETYSWLIKVLKEELNNVYPADFEDCRKGQFNRIPMVYVDTSVTFYPENYPFENYLCEGVLFDFLINREPELPDFMKRGRKDFIVEPSSRFEIGNYTVEVIATHIDFEPQVFDSFSFEVVTLEYLRAMGRAPLVMDFSEKPKIAHFESRSQSKGEFRIQFLREISLVDELSARRLFSSDPIEIELQAWLELPFKETQNLKKVKFSQLSSTEISVKFSVQEEIEVEEGSFLVVKVINVSEDLIEQGNFDYLFLRAELEPKLGTELKTQA